MAIVKIKKAKNGKIYVRCPFDENFIKDAKKENAKWNPILKMWIFPENLTEEYVGDIVESTFGPSAFNGKFKRVL